MTYLELTWLADVLRAEGCHVREESGWKDRGRPSSTGSFNPSGVLLHHTAAYASNANPHPSLNVCINGRSDLPGPLCQVLIGYDGTCHVIASGRANHAGECNGWGPFTSGDGNAQLAGIEIDYDGTQSISAAQRDAATRAAAGIVKRLGHDEGHVATHKETSTTGKWDTGGVSGDQWRNMIRDRLSGSGEDDDMPEYVNLSLTKPVALEKNVWTFIYWDTEHADTTGKAGVTGEAGVRIGGRKYAATLHASLAVPETGYPVKTRSGESAPGDDGDWERKETNPALEHRVTGGETVIQDTRTGWVRDEGRLRFEILSPVDAELTSANLVVLFW